MKTKIEIRTRWFGTLLFSYEKEDNTIKDTLLEAIKQGINLRSANLSGADLRSADLRSANLRSANLRSADLSGADLSGAEGCYIPFACPSDGAFVGWKKITDYVERGTYEWVPLLVKLLIPEDAKRCSATSNKCRCDKAVVLDITTLDESKHFPKVTNLNRAECTYKVGDEVHPDYFDEDRWNECSHGIHFFINKQEAIDY